MLLYSFVFCVSLLTSQLFPISNTTTTTTKEKQQQRAPKMKYVCYLLSPLPFPRFTIKQKLGTHEIDTFFLFPVLQLRSKKYNTIYIYSNLLQFMSSFPPKKLKTKCLLILSFLFSSSSSSSSSTTIAAYIFFSAFIH